MSQVARRTQPEGFRTAQPDVQIPAGQLAGEAGQLLVNALRVARELLGDELLSIVAFGSWARDQAHRHSDLDLLVVARSLPDEESRRELTLDIAEVGFDFGVPVQVILATQEETEDAARTGAPLMLEIKDAHTLVYDSGGFFHRVIRDLDERLRTWKARKIKDRVWEVPGLAATRL